MVLDPSNVISHMRDKMIPWHINASLMMNVLYQMQFETFKFQMLYLLAILFLF